MLCFYPLPFPRAGLLVGALAAAVLLSLPVAAQAQEAAAPQIDSLRRALATAPPDTNRLWLLSHLFRALQASADGEQVRPVVQEGARLARRLRHRQKEMEFRDALGRIVLNQQEYLEASHQYQLVARLAEQPPENAYYLARAYLGLGTVAGAQDDFVGAGAYFRQGVHWSEATTKAHPRYWYSVAAGYTSLAKAYAFRLQLPDDARPPDSLLRRTLLYVRQSQQAGRQLRALGDRQAYKGYLAGSWESLADLFRAKGQLDSAIVYKKRAITIYRELQAAEQIITQQQHLVNLLITKGDLPAAATLARQSQAFAHELGQPLAEADCLTSLALALSKLGDGQAAYRAMGRASTLRDSALSADTRSAISALQVQFETERKETRIRALTQREQLEHAIADRRRQQVWALVGLLGLVLIGVVIGSLLFVRLRRSREQLTKLSASKDRLYALIAHDLRGPVQALDGVAGMISYYLRRQDQAALADLPPLVSKAVGQVNQLLDNLLHWAASQTGELSFTPAPLSVEVLLDESVALWQNTAAAHQISLYREPLPVPLALTADQQMVRTVLRNLVGNALKFTPNGGTVTIGATRPTTGGLTLTVTDTGPGLAATEITTLLARTESGGPQRVRRPGARGEKGTGLGLRLCQMFMERHGGHLSLRSAPTLPGGAPSGTIAEAWFPRVVEVSSPVYSPVLTT